jgi:GNAT superfamily N-acetyltransferase
MREVQRAATQMFASVGMTTVAEAGPSPIEAFARYQTGARAWVVTGDDDVPIAYVLADVVDGFAHVTDIAVHPDFQRRGIGRRLLDHVAGWGRARGLTRLTLTTFRDVPWNEPFYERRGFRELRDDELTPALRDKFDNETRTVVETTGFGRSSRVYMGRDLR